MERRKQTRSGLRYPVYFMCRDHEGNITAQDLAVALDISDHGMLIESDSTLTEPQVKIIAAAGDGEKIEIEAGRIYSIKMPEGRFRSGLFFQESSDKNLRFVKEVMAASQEPR